MNPLSRIFIVLISIAGFFAIPASVMSFYLQWCLESPRFYTALVAESGLLLRPVEARLRKTGLDPKAFRKELVAAAEDEKKALDNRLAPAIGVKITAMQDWFSRGSPFPRLRFDLKDLRSDLIGGVAKAGYGQPLIAGYLTENYRGLPGAVDVDRWARFQKLRDIVRAVRPYTPTIFLLRKYVPAVSLVFLLLFLFSTFQIRPSFYYFASLLTASGCFFLIVFGLGLVADIAFAKTVLPVLAKVFPLPGPALPHDVMMKGWGFVVRTFCIQGLWTCLTMIAVGGLFYMTRRQPRRA
jgi:hypothetical protein